MNFPIIYSEKDIPSIVGKMLTSFEGYLTKQSLLVVGLSGDLGAGKTTLCKELLRRLQVRVPVVSPTFVLRKDYEGILGDRKVNVIHVDAYRLEKPENIQQVVNLKEITQTTIVLVEWAELADLKYDLKFFIEHISEIERKIVLV